MYKNKSYYQQGGDKNQEQQVMQQIVQVFQQLSPEAQQQVLQALSEMVSQTQMPTEEQAQEIMKMGGIRPRKNNISQMYR